MDRRDAVRTPKKRVVIVCEGKKTEPDYFAALRRRPESALVKVETIGGAGVPYSVAEKALEVAKENGLCGHGKPKNSFEEADEVWAVFDRDDHPKFNEAVTLCIDNRIGVGRSNPCFEIWLILHFDDYDKPDGRKIAQRTLSGFADGYDPDKRKTADFDKMLETIDEAERRAAVQLKRRSEEGIAFGAPSTTVFQLTRTIRGKNL